MIIGKDSSAYLRHYGILRKSGRYPWGSGEDQSTRNKTFLDIIEQHRRDGLSEKQIADYYSTPEHPFTTTQLRALRSIAGNEQRQVQIRRAQQLKDKHYSNIAIGKEMGINESSVRSLLSAGEKENFDILATVSKKIKDEIDRDGAYIDVGEGVENHLGIAKTKLATAVAMLEEQGYFKTNVQIDQVQGGNKKTTTKVLAPPGTTYRDVVANKGNIRQLQSFSEDGGRTMLGIMPPKSVSSKRIKVKYAEEGGKDEDGVMYVRPGVEDISFGQKRYAQVRVLVDDTHYMKGMAVYKDDLPDGVDIVYNSAKSNTGNKLDAMKKIKDDPDNPFGSIVNQIIKVGPNGEQILVSAMNKVGFKPGSGEEGAWDTWSKSLSTQVLSKQKPELAKKQLDETYRTSREAFDEIKSLTNPAVKRKLLESFADGADSSAVHLRAAALPRQRTQLLLPMNSLKPNEIYAPNFKNGERVALIRYPHAGTFEIPELIVNNGHRPAKKLLGQAQDAVAINSKVAERLSGADFDGDFVLVIPNDNNRIKTSPALKGLENFDPQRQYKLPDDAPKMSSRTKGIQMGLVSNLITDMTIKGASPDELARAVRHSMVVIDAEKHGLDYKQSAIDNGIGQLYKRYQNKAGGGGSTLFSTAKTDIRIPDTKLRSPKDGGPIDPKTGKLVFESTPRSFVTRDGTTVIKTKSVKKLANTDDAATLSSGTPIEDVYVAHSNRMKALANEARREQVKVKATPINPSAKKAYANEVSSLAAKLSLARRNKPLERQAQVFANATVAQKRAANPNMDADELKKVKQQAIIEARNRTGAAKQKIVPTAQEWAAIQAGAISNYQLDQILQNADLDAVKSLATPRTTILMSPARTSKARNMVAAGYTQAEIAEALGVSVSTLKNSLT